MDKPQVLEHAAKSVTLTIYDTKWVPGTASFMVVGSHARGTGALELYQLDHGKLVKESGREGAKSYKCGTFDASLNTGHFAVGDFDGRLSVHDVERSFDIVYSVAGAHEGMINCIAGVAGRGIGKGAPELVTGGRDGCVRVWDTRQKHAPVAALEPGDGQQARDCWAVAMGNSHTAQDRVVVAGFDNGDIKMMDLRKNQLTWEANVGNGICNLEFDRRDIEMNKLLVTTLENTFHVYDLRTFNEKREGYARVSTSAHKSTVWVGKHLPQNRDVFVTGGGNGALALWKYTYPAQRWRQETKEQGGERVGVAGTVALVKEAPLAQQPINCFDWHTDKAGLCVFGAFDQTVRVGIVTKLNKL